jgi:hypothetical protein
MRRKKLPHAFVADLATQACAATRETSTKVAGSTKFLQDCRKRQQDRKKFLVVPAKAGTHTPWPMLQEKKNNGQRVKQ